MDIVTDTCFSHALFLGWTVSSMADIPRMVAAIKMFFICLFF